MKELTKIELRCSEVRARLAELSDDANLDDKGSAEVDALVAEYRTLETRRRAALIAMSEDASLAETPRETGEGAELRQLRARASVGRYLAAGVAGQAPDGAERELNEAMGAPAMGSYGGVAIPWAALLPDDAEIERRAFTTTANLDGGIMQRPILQRLFGAGIFDMLGVRMDSVPAGRSEWPLFATGLTPAMKAEGAAAAAAVAATFSTEVLKPKRLTGEYEFTHEMAAQVADLEQALRRDLADAVMAEMQRLILVGDEGSNAEEPDGFEQTTTLVAAGTAVEAFASYAGSAARAVDGLHASREGEVNAVLGIATYQHAAGVYQAGSGEAGIEGLMRRCGGCMASPYIPAASGNIQWALYHGAGPNGGGMMRGDSVAAVWPTLEIIRDIYTQASQGVKLTWVSLWDAQTAYRSGAYVRRGFRLA